MRDSEKVASTTRTVSRNNNATKRCPILSAIHTWQNYENCANSKLWFSPVICLYNFDVTFM